MHATFQSSHVQRPRLLEFRLPSETDDLEVSVERICRALERGRHTPHYHDAVHVALLQALDELRGVQSVLRESGSGPLSSVQVRRWLLAQTRFPVLGRSLGRSHRETQVYADWMRALDQDVPDAATIVGVCEGSDRCGQSILGEIAWEFGFFDKRGYTDVAAFVAAVHRAVPQRWCEKGPKYERTQ